MIADKCLHPTNVNGQLFPCGKCAYCKAKRQLSWTIRGKHEGIYCHNKIFLTLTYNDKNLVRTAKVRENAKDEGGTLVPEHLTKFMKRLRYYIYPRKIKFIASGEYSPKKYRPHYHIIIFGLSNIDISEKEIQKLWKYGFVDLNRESFVKTNAVAYTVGYINKKITDSTSFEHYEGNGRIAPFQRQSQGIGLEWSKNNTNWYLNCKTGYNGRDCSIPRYYIKKVYEEEGRKVRLDNIIIRARDCNVTHYEMEDGDLFKGHYIIDGRSIETTEHTSKYYKVFINPNGEKTKQIINNLHLQAIQNLANDRIKYNMTIDEYTKALRRLNDTHEEQLSRWHKEWQDAINLTDEEIRAKYTHTTVRFTNRILTSQMTEILPPGMNKSNYIKAINESVQKNEHIKEVLKRIKRNGTDLSDELSEFCLKFK